MAQEPKDILSSLSPAEMEIAAGAVRQARHAAEEEARRAAPFTSAVEKINLHLVPLLQRLQTETRHTGLPVIGGYGISEARVVDRNNDRTPVDGAEILVAAVTLHDLDYISTRSETGSYTPHDMPTTIYVRADGAMIVRGAQVFGYPPAEYKSSIHLEFPDTLALNFDRDSLGKKGHGKVDNPAAIEALGAKIRDYAATLPSRTPDGKRVAMKNYLAARP
jgi:hypothetical protein